MISATGVQANHTSFLDRSIQPPQQQLQQQPQQQPQHLSLDQDDYIVVNERMESSIPGIFAAGDCCTYRPVYTTYSNNHSQSPLSPPHFFQMRLWTQARIMGTYAAQCLCDVEEDYGIDQHLELFAHVTRFFGLKVVLLGRYNAQGLGMEVERIAKRTVLHLPMQEDHDGASDEQLQQHKRAKLHETEEPPTFAAATTTSSGSAIASSSSSSLEIWSRVTPNKQFIKLMVYRGRIIGALLIGDTEMEEVFENLILNQLDVSSLGPDLLDPDHDLTDYFD